jgi:hypothetical protein
MFTIGSLGLQVAKTIRLKKAEDTAKASVTQLLLMLPKLILQQDALSKDKCSNFDYWV